VILASITRLETATKATNLKYLANQAQKHAADAILAANEAEIMQAAHTLCTTMHKDKIIHHTIQRQMPLESNSSHSTSSSSSSSDSSSKSTSSTSISSKYKSSTQSNTNTIKNRASNIHHMTIQKNYNSSEANRPTGKQKKPIYLHNKTHILATLDTIKTQQKQHSNHTTPPPPPRTAPPPKTLPDPHIQSP
jgi:hypothetical protein